MLKNKNFLNILIILLFISFNSYSQYNNKKKNITNYSYFQTCNIPKAPYGMCFFVHKKHIGFFAEFKFGGIRPHEELVKNWSPQTTDIDYSYYPWNTDYGSYEYSSATIKYRYGVADKYRVFNIGLSTSYYHTDNINMKVFLGIGLCRIKRQTIQETEHFSYSSLNLELVDYYDSSSDLDVYYDVIKTEYIHKLNVTGGLLFEWKGGGSLGIGVDSRALGVNLMAGFNF